MGDNHNTSGRADLTTRPFTRYFQRLRALWAAGITNQGHAWKSLPQTMTRQRSRRANFIQCNKELIAQYGYNLPRKVRRQIAWDSLKAGGQ